MDINYYGMVATFEPFVGPMTATRHGTLVGVASVAGVRGLPGSGAYSASKSAAIKYLEALRVELRPAGVGVVTIAPGYIRTPMTAHNPYRMPFLMDADRFAARAAQAIARQRVPRDSVADGCGREGAACAAALAVRPPVREGAAQAEGGRALTPVSAGPREASRAVSPSPSLPLPLSLSPSPLSVSVSPSLRLSVSVSPSLRLSVSPHHRITASPHRRQAASTLRFTARPRRPRRATVPPRRPQHSSAPSLLRSTRRPNTRSVANAAVFRSIRRVQAPFSRVARFDGMLFASRAGLSASAAPASRHPAKTQATWRSYAGQAVRRGHARRRPRRPRPRRRQAAHRLHGIGRTASTSCSTTRSSRPTRRRT